MQLKQISLMELLMCLKRHMITFLSYEPFELLFLLISAAPKAWTLLSIFIDV